LSFHQASACVGHSAVIVFFPPVPLATHRVALAVSPML
jgi:hypothetical protein